MPAMTNEPKLTVFGETRKTRATRWRRVFLWLKFSCWWLMAFCSALSKGLLAPGRAMIGALLCVVIDGAGATGKCLTACCFLAGANAGAGPKRLIRLLLTTFAALVARSWLPGTWPWLAAALWAPAAWGVVLLCTLVWVGFLTASRRKVLDLSVLAWMACALGTTPGRREKPSSTTPLVLWVVALWGWVAFWRAVTSRPVFAS